MPKGLVRLWLGFVPLIIIFQVVTQRIEFLVLGRYSTLSELAMYSVAFMVVNVAVSVPVSFVIAATPGVARSTGAAGESATLIDHLERACRVLLVLSVPIAAALMIFGPRLVLLVYGAEFAQASSLVPVLAIGLFLVPVGQLCETYWSGLGRIGVLLVWGTVAGTVDVGAALLTVPGLGALGAAVSNVLGQLTLSVAVLAYTRRRYRGLDVGARDVARMLGLCVVPAAASCAVLAAVPGWIGLACAAAVFCGLLLGVGSWLGLLRMADGHWLMAALPNRLTMVEPVLVGRQHVQRAR